MKKKKQITKTTKKVTDNFSSSIKNKKLANFIDKFLKLKNKEINFYTDGHFLISKGFCDIHVHLREPGFSNKETIKSGTLAAAHGGYTSICAMPNLNPAPDSLTNLKKELNIIKKDAVVDVLPYGRISKQNNINQLADLDKLAKYVCAYSDDGKGVQTSSIMEQAMKKVKSLNKIIAAHCEDDSLVNAGVIHLGNYAKKHHLKGICSASEYKQVERDLKLAKKIGVRYHICHVSTKESVELIRKAKRTGVKVTCETAPHYLLLNENNLKDEGRFKMNPPLRSKLDQLSLINGIKDGTIDAIATDHAPHEIEVKNKGLKGSAFGIVGLETSFSLLYTNLVKKKVITLKHLIDLLTIKPRKIFNIKDNGFTIFDLDNKYKIDSNKFYSKGKSTPFDKNVVYGKCVLTISHNKIVYKDKDYIK